jgi:hypothetical protein
MMLKNVGSATQVFSDEGEVRTARPGELVAVTVETAFRLLMHPREWAHAGAA